MHLVIIGGGLAGMSVLTTIAKKASKTVSDLRITLIDPKSFIEVRWASIRAMFDSKINDSSIVPYSKILAPYVSFVTHVTASVTSLNTQERRVTLSTGELVDQYDVCLISTGSKTTQAILTPQDSSNESQSEPESVAARRADLISYGEKLLSASNVLVIGGGPIGCELAGDIAGYAKMNDSSVKVTLVQSKPLLIPDFGTKAPELVYKKLQKLGVSIKLNMKAFQSSEDESKWELRDAKNTDEKLDEITVSSGLVFNATGVQSCLSTSFFQDLDEVMDEHAWLLPDDFGVIKGTNNRLFAMGDCVKGSPKSGVEALDNKNIMADNILHVLVALQQQADTSSMSSFKELSKEHQQGAEAHGIVTVGPTSGVAIMPFGTTRILIPYIKNKTMFVFKVKSDIGWH